MSNRQRQAVSGVLAAVVLIGITISLAALVLTFGSEFAENALVVEPITIGNISIKNSGNTSYIHATVKNTGNIDLVDTKIKIFDSDLPNGEATPVPIGTVVTGGSSTSIKTGITASVTKSITTGGDSDTPHHLPYGKEVLVQITAMAGVGGPPIESELVTIRVSKN